MWLRLSSVPGDSQQPGFAQGGGHLQFDGTVATKERHGPIVVQIDDCCDFEVQIRDVNHGIGILGFMIDDEKERLAQAASIEARASDKPAARAVPVDVVGPNLVKDIRLETSNGRSHIVVELDDTTFTVYFGFALETDFATSLVAVPEYEEQY